MSQLTVIAKRKADGCAEEQLFAELRRLVAPTRVQEGCVNYELQDPGTFMFAWNWESRPLWERHMESPHLKAFSGPTEGLVAVWGLFPGEKVEDAA